MRVFYLILIPAVLLSCRDLESPSDLGGVEGYELRGKVVTKNGLPLEEVQVSLYYYYQYISDRKLDTVQIVITDTSQILEVTVLKPDLSPVRKLFLGKWRTLGPLQQIYWNGRDDENRPMPSGLYYMDFRLDSLFIKRNSLVIEGNVTAVSDIYGRFTVRNQNLPVGVIFDAYRDDGSFNGVFKLEPEIALVLRSAEGGNSATYESIRLTKNIATSVALTME